jgi:peptidoglycan hydrolase CwlO-like protein
MTQLSILLVQSVTGAVITIIALLLVAAIIGYFTAWFYAKSVYTPIIKSLEEEKAELNKQITGLKSDISKLNGEVDKINGEKEKLNDEVNKLNKKITKNEEEIAEKDKEIKQLKKGKG